LANGSLGPATPVSHLAMNGTGGHYAANISAAGHTSTLAGSKQKPVLESAAPSSAPHLATSPQQLCHESQLGPHLLSTGPSVASLSDPTLACSSLSCNGIRELLASLALMCILSILMAFLALFFLQKSCSL